MTAPTDNLYSAFLARMLNEPEEAYEVITGTRCWPPLECDKLSMRDALWNLELDAIEFVKKAEALAAQFPPYGVDRTWIIRTRAARDAIMAIRQEHIEYVDPWYEYPMGARP